MSTLNKSTTSYPFMFNSQTVQVPPPPPEQKQTKPRRPRVTRDPSVLKKTTKQTNGLAGKWLKMTNKFANVDAKGTHWLVRSSDVDAPKRLNEIPTDGRHNEVEFVRWQSFDVKKTGGKGYLLFTAKEEKYWGDVAANKWLQQGESDGLVPGQCTFVVRHDKSKGLDYGFRYTEGENDENKPEDNSSSASSSNEDPITPEIEIELSNN